MDTIAEKRASAGEQVREDSDQPLRDPDTLKLLHEEARRALHEGVASFGTLEEKIGRHLTVLAVLLGTFTISLPNAIDVWADASGVLAGLFGAAYVGFAISTFAGLYCLMRALGYHVLNDNPIDAAFVNTYGRQDSTSVLAALAKGAVESVLENKAARIGKEEWAARGYVALWWVFGFAFATIFLYLVSSVVAPGL